MKKLLTLSIILLLASNIFGQTSGVFGLISAEPEYVKFEKQYAKGNVISFIDGTTPMYRVLSLTYYHFIKDNKLYMLSYGDRKPDGLLGGVYYERKLYLMCWNDGVWSKASDVIQVDQKFENNGIRGYLPMFDGDFGGRVDEVGNSILITLANHYIPDGDFSRSGICSSVITLKKFVLMPNGDGTYIVIHDTKNE